MKGALAGAILLLLLSTSCAAQRPASSTHESDAPGAPPGVSQDGWKTDWSRHSVPLSEITSGGPPRDGIPPIDRPQFVNPTEAVWLKGREPVIVLSLGSEHRAYPLQILIWHEIVNDQVGDTPLTVTFCPLCNTALAFDRRVEGRVLDFGTTGNLRKSDLVMWDRQTESWWQQATGAAIVGAMTGKLLNMLPVSIASFDSFRSTYPEGRVLSRETGFTKPYGENPYVGYDEVGKPPFLFVGQTDGRLPPKERVVTVRVGAEEVAYPYPLLRMRRVVTDTVGGTQIVVLYQTGTVSPLDAPSIADGSDVGSSGVFGNDLDGRRLTFSVSGDGFRDTETGSHWNLLGDALSGPLAGRRLEPIFHGDHFWFAWAAFQPKTRIYR